MNDFVLDDSVHPIIKDDERPPVWPPLLCRECGYWMSGCKVRIHTNQPKCQFKPKEGFYQNWIDAIILIDLEYEAGDSGFHLFMANWRRDDA